MRSRATMQRRARGRALLDSTREATGDAGADLVTAGADAFADLLHVLGARDARRALRLGLAHYLDEMRSGSLVAVGGDVLALRQARDVLAQFETPSGDTPR